MPSQFIKTVLYLKYIIFVWILCFHMAILYLSLESIILILLEVIILMLITVAMTEFKYHLGFLAYYYVVLCVSSVVSLWSFLYYIILFYFRSSFWLLSYIWLLLDYNSILSFAISCFYSCIHLLSKTYSHVFVRLQIFLHPFFLRNYKKIISPFVFTY